MTTLHGALGRKCNLVTFHAPHPNDGLDPERDRKKTAASFVKSVTAPLSDQCIGEGLKRYPDSAGGIATGRLIGGNLAVLASTIGTEYAPDFNGAILFLEETDEKPYRVDRFLSQLRLAGDLDRLAGVILGHFTDCETKDPEHSLTLQQVFGDYFGSLNVPIVTGMNCGHAVPNLTLPMNATVVLDTNSGKLTVQSKPS